MDERTYLSFDLAPDDRRIAVQVADVRDYVWIWDGAAVRDLAGPDLVGWPVWSPDGSALAVMTRGEEAQASQIVRHDLGTGAAETLLSRDHQLRPNSWAGDQLGFTEYGPQGRRVGVAEVGQDAGAEIAGFAAALSPDGTWVAYGQRGGRGGTQVWVEEVGGGTRRQVSTEGGLEPVWCRACDELFYRNGDRILAARIATQPQLAVGAPRVVFEARGFVDTFGLSYRVSSDGARLYYVRRTTSPVRDRIHVIHNLFSELERLAPSNP